MFIGTVLTPQRSALSQHWDPSFAPKIKRRSRLFGKNTGQGAYTSGVYDTRHRC
ncbi:hypothetical protein M378DRAFT_154838 [Amanita muscaria Koide BX008]|uniref:Uncharacterized protein n=1 Tax=Amanita muscaria (strain Koide BX008) TaxID=946122 RepID=A0A0C2XNV9_AMAMK|nr:hypothetical protein M378DRAFT_154838 [Amanita muscaria Koide BX008]